MFIRFSFSLHTSELTLETIDKQEQIWNANDFIDMFVDTDEKRKLQIYEVSEWFSM